MRDTLDTGRSVAVVSSNRTLPFRVFAALLAGMIALAANIALLSIASAAGIRTAHGGLFLLFTRIIHRVAPSRSFMDGWKIFAPPVPQAVFHIVTGLVMAIFYALVLEPKLPGRPFFKGVAYGTAIWFLNAFLVLPLTDEGIAGSRHINTVGLIAFALAHMSFFLVLSVLYGFLCSGVLKSLTIRVFESFLSKLTIAPKACSVASSESGMVPLSLRSACSNE